MDTSNNTKKYNKKLADNQFVDLVQGDLEDIIFSNDIKKARDLADWLQEAIDKNKKFLENYPEIIKFYKKTIIKAKFVALPLLDNQIILDLIKNHFTWQFRIDNYNIIEKLKNKLNNIIVYEDRDKFKNEIKNILLNSNLIITNKATKKTIREWLNDYNSQVGLDPANSVKKTKYFIKLKENKDLDEYARKKMNILLEFYEKLKLSSLSPEGFEEDVPIVIDNKFYVFKQGRLEPIGEQKVNRKLDIPKTEEEKQIDNLQNLLQKYPEGSLERRVVEEEIKRIKNE